LINKKIQGQNILDEMNLWAVPMRFKLKYPQGFKMHRDSINRIVSCQQKSCKFKLVFNADKPLNYINLEKAEQNKINNSSLFTLDSDASVDIHNHPLNFYEKEQFTEEIINEINLLKGTVKTMAELQIFINKKYKKSFEYFQIAKQVNKLMDETFGQPGKDALGLIEDIEKEKSNDCGEYRLEKDPVTNQLKKLLYVSKTMLTYKEKFLDVVIVDSTYKRNRFNMPVVNIIGINNYGRNILLAFCLLNEETSASYSWVFDNLKTIWLKEPNCIISDESQAIISGLFYSLFFI